MSLSHRTPEGATVNPSPPPVPSIPQGVVVVRRIEKVSGPHWGYERIYTLRCGHFFGGERRDDLKSRQHVVCPVCPDKSYDAANQVYPASALRPPVAVLQEGPESLLADR